MINLSSAIIHLIDLVDPTEGFLKWKKARDETELDEEEDMSLIKPHLVPTNQSRPKKKRKKAEQSIFAYVFDRETGEPRPGKFS